MAIKTTRWSPDTCGCVIEYTWDDSLPNDQISTTPSNVITRCSAHTTLANNTAVFNTLFEENPRKNISFQHILDNAPTTLFDVNTDGSRQLKAGMSISWAWTGTAPNRVITLTVKGITLTTNQKNTIQSALNSRFGIGKVVIA
jgi:hypothetical protein